MLEKLKRILLEFQERSMRTVIRRDGPFPILKGKATVITGMRRVGKTWSTEQSLGKLLH